MLVERPALVTSVHEDERTVNLTVFFERYDEDVCVRGRVGDISEDPRYEGVQENSGGDAHEAPEPNTWRWPPRV